MKIFDAHCDVLWRLWHDKHLNFAHDHALHVTYEYLSKYPGTIQCMAIYIPESVPEIRRFDVALEMVHIFYEKIVKPFEKVKVILNQNDVAQLQEDEIGVILTLEGCDAIGKEMNRLRILHYLGVRSVGLTWNYGNGVADGIMEERGAGLTNFGKDLVRELNDLKIWTDVSHLSVQGFWDVLELADNPVATHSNCYQLCPHPRNLSDEQIQALIGKNGLIGMNFYSVFLSDNDVATISDILNHIDHICKLGGEKNVGLGSDFDGISHAPIGLENFGRYDNLINEMLKHYSAKQVEDFCFHNFTRKVL